MNERISIVLELGLLFLASFLWLSRIVSIALWWQLVLVWILLLLLTLITEKLGLPSIGLVIASYLLLLGWLFVTRIDPDYGIHHWQGLMLGTGAYLASLFIHWHNFKYKYLWGFIGCIILLVTCIFGDNIGGARAWLTILSVRFQPVEIAKVFVLLFIAGYFHDNRELLTMKKSWPDLQYWGPLFILIVGLFLFLVAQRDLGPVLLFFMMFVTLSLYICFNWYSIITYLSVAFLGAVIAWFSFDHIQQRLAIWINPWKDIDGVGYQIVHGLFSVSNGGLLGAGLGNGTGINIPALHTDYIFALISEELGFFGTSLILLLYLFLVFFAFKTAKQASGKSHILAIGIGLLWAYQFFIVVAGIIKVIPLSGMTLPFVSYGTTSIIINMWLLGLVTKLAQPDTNHFDYGTLGRKGKKDTKKLLYLIICLFVILWVGLGYWQIIRTDLHAHPHNPRTHSVFRNPRGTIYDRKGDVLAFTDGETGSMVRYYPGPSGLSHLLGYFHPRYGMTGLESVYNKQLANYQDIFLTIDSKLQCELEMLMDQYIGAAVVMQPRTGELLAVCSSPAVDSNLISQKWDSYHNDVNSPFYNRAFLGLYPPGSAIKPFILAGGYQTKVTDPTSIWHDQGVIAFAKHTISNFNNIEYGSISSQEALAYSSNVVFSQLAIAMQSEVQTYLQAFGFGEVLAFELDNKAGSIPTGEIGIFNLAQIGIGQGQVLVTPLQMAAATATIANRGVRMKPYLVRSISGNLFTRMTTRPVELHQVISQYTAALVKDAMIDTVEFGTAKAAKTEKFVIAGKTGTAEIANGRDHSWFVGFAPADDPKIVVSVIIEQGGSGGGLATQIAREILLAALELESYERLISW